MMTHSVRDWLNHWMWLKYHVWYSKVWPSMHWPLILPPRPTLRCITTSHLLPTTWLDVTAKYADKKIIIWQSFCGHQENVFTSTCYTCLFQAFICIKYMLNMLKCVWMHVFVCVSKPVCRWLSAPVHPWTLLCVWEGLGRSHRVNAWPCLTDCVSNSWQLKLFQP